MSREREQKLVDICFQIAMTVKENHATFEDNEAVAKWVARQLRECGFPTHPVGASWGVLDR